MAVVGTSLQAPPAQHSIRERLDRAAALARHDERLDAEREASAALEEAVRTGDRWAEAEAKRILASVWYDAARYAEARASLEQSIAAFDALKDRERAALARHALGSTMRMLGDSAAAQALYRDVIAEFRQLGNRTEEVRAIVSLAYVLPPPEDEITAQEGLEGARALGDAVLQARASHLLGDLAFVRGDFQQALARYETAVSLYESTNRDSDLARVLTSLGRLHRAHGRAAEALPFYERGLAIQERVRDEFGAIQTLNAMAVAHGELRHVDTALEHYERALARARRSSSPQVVTFLLANTGTAYIQAGRAERGIAMLKEALAITPGSPNAMNWHAGLAIGLRSQGAMQEALEHASRSVELARSRSNTQFLPTALNILGSVRRLSGDLEGALAAAREAIDGIEAVRLKLVPLDFMKRGFAEQSEAAFDQIVTILHRLGREGEAFEMAERARARAFLDLLATREAQAGAAPGPALARPAPGNSSAAVVAPAARELALQTAASAPAASLPEMAAIAAHLRSTVLAYWVSADATIIWVITSDGRTRSARVEVSSEKLARLVRQTWETSVMLAARRGASGERAQAPIRIAPPPGPWRRLHDLLIAPVSKYLPASGEARLTIIPHRALLRLSFAALEDSRHRYLVERYAIHYAPAGGALSFTRRRDEELQRADMRLLLVADPSPLPTAAQTPGEVPLARLPEAVREVRAIAGIFARSSITMLEGLQADERSVRSALDGRQLLHFATHAVVNDEDPWRSFLALGAGVRGEDGPEGDGRLTVEEMYGLRLDARLVVLSGCRTAGGKVSGDGLLGLSRALFYAGTPAIVAAMWDVADETTRVQMEYFYREWPRRPRGDALRAAQLRFLRDLRAGRVRIATPAGPARVPNHPFYWAAFVLLGEF